MHKQSHKPFGSKFLPKGSDFIDDLCMHCASPNTWHDFLLARISKAFVYITELNRIGEEMSSDVNRHEIELDMVLLNNEAVFAAAAILIVDIIGVVVCYFRCC